MCNVLYLGIFFGECSRYITHKLPNLHHHVFSFYFYLFSLLILPVVSSSRSVSLPLSLKQIFLRCFCIPCSAWSFRLFSAIISFVSSTFDHTARETFNFNLARFIFDHSAHFGCVYHSNRFGILRNAQSVRYRMQCVRS